ncbi:MAG: DUF6763 family protein [Steroidobacteraceae bacterium]
MKAFEGQWYADRSSNDVFCVIAVDDSDGWIDVRDLYGDIDEFDFDEWESMDLELCATPEEWSRGDAEGDGDADGAEQPGSQPLHHLSSSGTT